MDGTTRNTSVTKPLHFSSNEALRFGWETFKKYPLLLIGATALVGAINYFPTLITGFFTENGNSNELISLLITLLFWPVQVSISMGIYKIALQLTAGKKTEFSTILFSDIKSIFNYIFASIIYGLAVGVGLILLIVPGIYFAIKYQFYLYFIIEKKMGAFQALENSGKITDGQKWELLKFNALTILITIAGVLAILLGLLVAMPVVTLAAAYVYKKLSETAS